MNEVIANRSLQILGLRKGNYSYLHPNDHVNLSQSTNDVYPTAMRITSLDLVLNELIPNLKDLEASLSRKAKEFYKIHKSGRTHLQDALPITLGDEFNSYSVIMEDLRFDLEDSLDNLYALGIGGTAVGTGANTPKNYTKDVIKSIKELSRLKVYPAKDMFSAMNSMKPFTTLSGVMRNLAVELTKIGNDLRLLQSGPTTGLKEISLPVVQPGSSIMPGKVNPSVVECLQMICFQVIGNDQTILEASEAGQLELNVFMPIINYNLLQSIKILSNGLKMFDKKCISGIKADKKVSGAYMEKSMGLAAILNPVIGFDKSAEVAKEALKTGVSIKDLVIKKGILSKKDFEDLLKKNL